MLSPPATGIDMLLGAVGADIAEIELPAGSCSARRAGNRLGVLPGGAPAIQEACQEAIWRCFPEARGRSRHLFAFRQKAPGLRGDRPCAPALLERRRSTDMTEGGGKCKFIRLSEHGSQQPRNQPSPPPPKGARNSVMALFWPVWELYWELYWRGSCRRRAFFGARGREIAAGARKLRTGALKLKSSRESKRTSISEQLAN
jgi:hypothetical protein